MKVLLPTFGGVQILIAWLLSHAMDTDGKFKTGLCSCLACVVCCRHMWCTTWTELPVALVSMSGSADFSPPSRRAGARHGSCM
jgi:hypothetical protein